jgi:hypothetical protein
MMCIYWGFRKEYLNFVAVNDVFIGNDMTYRLRVFITQLHVTCSYYCSLVHTEFVEWFITHTLFWFMFFLGPRSRVVMLVQIFLLEIVLFFSCTMIHSGMTVIVENVLIWDVPWYVLQYITSATLILVLLWLLFTPWVLPTKLSLIVNKTPCLGVQTGRHPGILCCLFMEIRGCDSWYQSVVY